MIASTDTKHKLHDEHQWWLGFAAYCDGTPYACCRSESERRGWRDAKRGRAAAEDAAAEVETTDYLARLRQRDLDVDAAQGCYNDWRFA